MQKVFLFLLLSIVLIPNLVAQNFDSLFINRTLRVDYMFSGDSLHQSISLDEMSSSPLWAGRRHHLDSLFQKGNGQIFMHDEATGKLIYCNSFSTLFQEWLLTSEAAHQRKAFENSFLLPMPKRPSLVSIQLTNNRQQVVAQYSHRIDPSDILIRKFDSKPIPSHRYLYKGGEEEKCIDIAIVAEGYTQNEINVFYEDARIAMESLFAHEPFKKMKERFNIVAVALSSTESGVSVPSKGVWKQTALGSHFDTFYSERYLTTPNIKTMHNALAPLPYEHIIVLANTETYGGGGILNSYTLTTTHNSNFRPVVVHEFGHSFCGLADEYFYDDQHAVWYPLDVEPWEKNITTLVDFDKKWKDMLPNNASIPGKPSGKLADAFTKIGVYEGAGYQSKGVYRGLDRCRMRDNEAPSFCAVCQRALQNLILYYTE
ncbi:MAG: M64 family metallopeptidase [Bacteroidaceae bacterium]